MDNKAAELDELYGAYGKLISLQPVADGKRMICGAGPLDAPLVVVGEAPGREEDLRGEPFVGPSGKLLQHLFARAGLPWEFCYRMNVLPWRPPGNRTPDNFEIVDSYNRVEREIAIISPLIVVAAGAVAWQAVTRGQGGRFSAAVGNWAESGFPYRLLPIWHPAFILRSAGYERDRFELDMVQALHFALAEQ